MKYKRIISVLTIIILILSGVASACGIFWTNGAGDTVFQSLHKSSVKVYGFGLYKNESFAMALQARAQDAVTLCLGVPCLFLFLRMARKGYLKGKLLLLGLFGYILYTYTIYSMGAMYNQLFLIYVALMSTSFFAFLLMFSELIKGNVKSKFSPVLPVNYVSICIMFIAAAVAMMWLKRILVPLMAGAYPKELEHYTTMVIQAVDLAILLPTGVIAGILLIKRDNLGYILAPVMVIKEMGLAIAIIAMYVNQIANGIKVDKSELVIFLLIALLITRCMYLIINNIKE